ncbi:MAG: Ig-like domain-containing protein [Gemmatales bacterium]
MSQKRRRFIPNFDRLEDRWVPAGNVIVKFDAGVLYIRGDDEANSIKITGQGSGTVMVSVDGDDTTINGGTTPAPFLGVQSINAKMKGGDDVVNVKGVYLTKVFELELGDGNDTAIIDHLHTGRESAVYGQAGDDTITITNGDFRKYFNVMMGSGDDTLNTVGNYFGKNSLILGGAGTDVRNSTNNGYGNNSWIGGFETTTKLTPGAPQAVGDTGNVDQGDQLTLNVASNDLALGRTLDLTSIVITQAPTNGTAVANDDGTITYTHNGSNTTTDSFKYTIKNTNGTVSNAATVSLTINHVDQAPVAVNDTASVVRGSFKDIAVAANDTDDQNQLDFTTITFTQQPAHGTLSLNLNGTVRYTHDGSAGTSDTFKYTIKDLTGNVSNVATVTLTIGDNVSPTAVADTATVAEGGEATINVASNDTDTDGSIDLTSIVITQQPTHGTLTVNTNGTVKYTHDGSETTSDSFKYTIKDNLGALSNEATVTITITPVNDAPVAGPDSATVVKGNSVTIDLANNDTDVDGTIVLTTIVIKQQPSHGSITVNNDGTVTYHHDGSSSTSDSFTYTINDNTGAPSNEANVTITITAPNIPPVAFDDADSVAMNGSKKINLAGNDTDADGTIDLTSIVITQQPAHGTLVVNNDGTVTYTQDGTSATGDSFKYTIKDNTGAVSNEANVVINLLAGNTAPTAVDDGATLDEGTSKVIDLLGNDSDADGTLDPATLVITQAPTHGTLVLHADGTVTYTQDGSETTSDSFKYTVRDNLGTLSNEATVSITINPVNDAPIAGNDSATVDEGGNVLINLIANDSDVDGTLDLNSFVVTQAPAHGTLTFHGDGTVTYTHDGSETTSDSFSYTIKDNDGAPSNEATVSITINPVNDAPVALDDTGSVHTGFSTAINLAGNDSDVDGTLDLTSIEITQAPAHGTFVIHADGTVTYTHDGSATTSDSFKYTIKDNDGKPSNEATVTITIADNQVPVAGDDSASVRNGQSVVINLVSNDSDADGILDLTSIVITGAPAHGTLVLHNDGTVTYTHDGSAGDSDSFKYTIKDNEGGVSNEATVNITISTNQLPVAQNDSGSVHTGFSTVINLASNDSDADGSINPNSIVITQAPEHGTLVDNHDGTVTYTHDGSATTADTFAYTIKDNEGGVSNAAIVTILIADNQAPVAQNDTGSVVRGSSTVLHLASNDNDPDGTLDLNSIVITQAPAHGTLVDNHDGTWTYTHDGSSTLADVFAYLIKDTEGALSNNAIVTLTITL